MPLVRCFLTASLCIALLGCGNRHQSYMRHPLIRDMNVTAGPVRDRESSTQAQPYPPPRPLFPADTANLANVPASISSR